MSNEVKCPLCGSATTLRTAKKGSNAGEQFYVCELYPECKGKVKYGMNDVEEGRSKLKKLMSNIPSEIQWPATFEGIIGQISPVMGKVSKASGKGEKEMIDALKEAASQFPIMLVAMKEIPEPPKEEYKKSREDLMKALECYIQGCRLHIKWLETKNDLYLSEGVAYFNDATAKFGSSSKWLAKK